MFLWFLFQTHIIIEHPFEPTFTSTNIPYIKRGYTSYLDEFVFDFYIQVSTFLYLLYITINRSTTILRKAVDLDPKLSSNPQYYGKILQFSGSETYSTECLYIFNT